MECSWPAATSRWPARPPQIAMTPFHDGSSEVLYAGGQFTTAGGVSASRIAKWNGTVWSALGTGMDNSVLALLPYNYGAGPGLYAGGFFTNAGGTAVGRIARW